MIVQSPDSKKVEKGKICGAPRAIMLPSSLENNNTKKYEGAIEVAATLAGTFGIFLIAVKAEDAREMLFSNADAQTHQVVA